MAKSFLDRCALRGIDCNINYEEITSCFKILISLFADDTVLFADSELELQHEINVFQDYCSIMKLTVNVSKTEIVIFTNARISNHINFMFDLQPIEIVSEYKYDFHKMINSILLYGSEIWGTGNCDIIERVQLKYIKYIFKLKKSTPSQMIYGELGIMPIITEIQTCVVSFWSKLIDNQGNLELSADVNSVIHAMYENNHLKSKWIENIKHLLCSLGFSGI